jgi:hypothetical protein
MTQDDEQKKDIADRIRKLLYDDLCELKMEAELKHGLQVSVTPAATPSGVQVEISETKLY